MEITEPGTRVFAVVLRSAMPTSTEPYRLTVRGSVPPLALAETIGMSFSELNTAFGGFGELEAACTGAHLVPGSIAGSPIHPGGSTTIFVTQRERMIQLYGEPAWNDMFASLQLLAADPAIDGTILSVSSDLYDNWDENPCSVQAANDTAAGIRAELLDYLDGTLASAQYIVIVGNDDVIPFYRVNDTTLIGNESNYAMGTFLQPGSPLFHSTDEGYILTQDFYADLVPTPFGGSAVYVPDMPIGRLVETPLEIQAQADAYVASEGELAIETAAVAGYDFFTDHSNAVATELTNVGVVVEPPAPGLLDGGWNASDLRCSWGIDCPDVPDLSDQSAHYTHWGALSASGFDSHNYDDYVSSTEITTAGADADPGRFEYHLGFTIGCHAGFIAPDDDVVEGVFPFDPALDLAQAMAQSRAIWIASTGYAIGDDEALNYTELLMFNYAQALLNGPGGVAGAGQALVDAKVAYLGALGEITNYDQKVSIEMTLYGLPHYQAVINPDGDPVPLGELEAQIQSMALDHIVPGPGLTSIETLELTPVLDRVIAASGSYDVETFYSDGDYETILGRPTMPRIVLELDGVGLDPVHGAVLIGGSYALDPASPAFDPWIGVPMLEWTEVPPEAQICLPIYWPEPVKLNSIGGSQRAIVYPAAFRCDPSQPGTDVLGDYRMFTEQTVRVYRSPDAEEATTDVTPPLIHEVNLSDNPSSTGVIVSVDASDTESDIVEIIVVRYRDSDGTVTHVSDEPAPTDVSPFTVELPDFHADDEHVIHVVDAAGNIGTYSAKGYLLRFIDVDAQDALSVPGVPTLLTATVFGFDASGSEPGLAQPTSFIWNFGDGQALGGELDASNPDFVQFSVDANGNATFTVAHTYGAGLPEPVEATVRVVDGNGSVGMDTALVFLSCTDTADDVILDDAATIDPAHADIIGCGASIVGDEMTIALFMAGDLDDPSNPIGDIQFRLRLGLEGKSSGKLVKYRDGDTTGMKSLSVTLDGQAIHFTFSLKELGRKGPLSDAAVTFSTETRDGAASTGAAGLLDVMPDDASVVTFHE